MNCILGTARGYCPRLARAGAAGRRQWREALRHRATSGGALEAGGSGGGGVAGASGRSSDDEGAPEARRAPPGRLSKWVRAGRTPAQLQEAVEAVEEQGLMSEGVALKAVEQLAFLARCRAQRMLEVVGEGLWQDSRDRQVLLQLWERLWGRLERPGSARRGWQPRQGLVVLWAMEALEIWQEDAVHAALEALGAEQQAEQLSADVLVDALISCGSACGSASVPREALPQAQLARLFRLADTHAVVSSLTPGRLAELAAAVAVLGYDEAQHGGLVRRLSAQACHTIGRFSPAALTQLLAAGAALGGVPAPLQRAAAAQAAALLARPQEPASQFQPGEVAALLSAAAQLQMGEEALLQQAAAYVRLHLEVLSADEAAVMCWAFGRLQPQGSDNVVDLLAQRANALLDGFSPRGIADMVAGLALMGGSPPPAERRRTAAVLVQQAVLTLHEFRPGDLADLLWGAAALGGVAPSGVLLDAAARLVELLSVGEEEPAGGPLGLLTPQQLSGLAWAYASLDCCNAPLLHAVARHAQACMPSFSAGSLAEIAWAFAHCGQADRPLLAAMAARAEEVMQELAPSELATTLWAFAVLGLEDDPLVEAAVDSAVLCMDAFNAVDLARLTWAVSAMGVKSSDLMDAAAQRSVQLMAERSDTDMCTSSAAIGEPDDIRRVLGIAEQG